MVRIDFKSVQGFERHLCTFDTILKFTFSDVPELLQTRCASNNRSRKVDLFVSGLQGSKCWTFEFNNFLFEISIHISIEPPLEFNIILSRYYSTLSQLSTILTVSQHTKFSLWLFIRFDNALVWFSGKTLNPSSFWTQATPMEEREGQQALKRLSLSSEQDWLSDWQIRKWGKIFFPFWKSLQNLKKPWK